MVSGREISQNGIPEGGQSWVNRHLAYTHGYGAVASVVNTANADGQPLLTLQGIPVSPTAVPSLTQPRIYYGEQNDVPFVIVGAQTPEIDYEGTLQHEQYQGDGGIAMGNIFTRAMFAWKFRDVNLLISGQIRSDSRILLYRDIQTRVPKAVPFLSFDSDPYLAIVDGGLKWIWDAYTTTTEYPYAQTVDVGLATDDSLAGDANYMRNSVKAVVDAYDGTIEYYADLREPIIQAWGAAFPGLFTDIGLAPESLRDHFRYPENLFQVQAFQWANYHVEDPSVFYQKQDFWQVPFDPTVPIGPGGAAPKIAPYYQLMRLPTDETEGFLLVLPFVPQDRQNMVAWMAASSDPDEYGKLVSYRFPAGQTIDGPSQIVARINADRDFSSRRSLLDQAGSSVAFGDFLVIPLEDSFLYVQPVYVQADTPNSIPELGFVIVVNGSGGPISLGTSLEGALAQAVAGEEPPVGPGQPGGGGTLERRIEQLLAEALEHFAAADAALMDGDLATYQAQLRLAQQAVQDARELAATRAGDQPGATPTPTPTPTVSGSPETVSPTSASPAPAAP
jgi:uncharacterized membrane protein (UPF0182 family)